MTENPDLNGDFTISSGEAITITVQAFGTPNRCTTALDGQAQTPTNVPGGALIFRPMMAGSAGNVHLFAAQCPFIDEAPANAHYKATIASSEGSSFAIDPEATPDSPEFLLRFTLS